MSRFALILALLPLAALCQSSAPTFLAADFSAHLVCEPERTSQVEPLVEAFFSQQGFQVLNLGKVQRLHGVHLQKVRILGIDERRRMVEFMSLDYMVGRYAIKLNSEPPTRRSIELEAKLEALPATLPTCKFAQVLRSSNDSGALPIFESEARRVRSLFRQAEKMKGNS